MRFGFGEIVVVLVLALLFFGPSKLPALGASIGEAIKGLKKGLREANEIGSPNAAPPLHPLNGTPPDSHV